MGYGKIRKNTKRGFRKNTENRNGCQMPGTSRLTGNLPETFSGEGDKKTCRANIEFPMFRRNQNRRNWPLKLNWRNRNRLPNGSKWLPAVCTWIYMDLGYIHGRIGKNVETSRDVFFNFFNLLLRFSRPGFCENIRGGLADRFGIM